MKKTLLIKLTEEQLKKIKEQAEKYTDGNVSLWLRMAAINYKPRR